MNWWYQPTEAAAQSVASDQTVSPATQTLTTTAVAPRADLSIRI